MTNPPEQPTLVNKEEAKLLPRCKKLQIGGDIYSWMNSVLLHFEALGLLDLIIKDNSSSFDTNEELKKKDARCKRDILHVLDDQLQITIRYLSTAHKMFETIKKMFLGGKIAELSKLIENCGRLRFQGNYFTFRSEYQSAVTQIHAVNPKGTGYAVLSM